MPHKITSSALLLVGLVAASPAYTKSIALDGEFDDWDTGQIAAADGRHLHFRVAFPEMRSLHQGDDSVVIAIALDADDSTGDPDAAEPGADLMIRTNTEVEQRRWARIAEGQPNTLQVVTLEVVREAC